MDSKKKLVSNLNYKIGQCLIKSRSSPIFKFNICVSERLLQKLKLKFFAFSKGQSMLAFIFFAPFEATAFVELPNRFIYFYDLKST